MKNRSGKRWKKIYQVNTNLKKLGLLLLLSCFSRVRLCVTPQTAAHQLPPSMGFSRQEYRSGVPLPSPKKLGLAILIHRLPRQLSGKESTCQYKRSRRCGFDPWIRKIPGERNGNPIQYSWLENPTERGAWQATVHGVAKSPT